MTGPLGQGDVKEDTGDSWTVGRDVTGPVGFYWW